MVFGWQGHRCRWLQMPVWLSGDFRGTGMRDRIKHGLGTNKSINHRAAISPVTDLVAVCRYTDGDYRCTAIYPACLRHHKNTFSDEHLVGISHSSRMLAVGLLSAVLVVGQKTQRVSVLTERGGARAVKVGGLGRSLSGCSGQYGAVAGLCFSGKLGKRASPAIWTYPQNYLPSGRNTSTAECVACPARRYKRQC